MHRIVITLTGTIALLTLAGCVSSTVGSKIDRSNVEQIKKGVTTRAEVEALLGSPDNVSMMGDGRRLLLYHFAASQEKSGHGLMRLGSFIPGIGGVATTGVGAANAGNTSQRQLLQIFVSKEGIVQDYEYSDKTTDVSATPFGTKATTTETEKK